MGHALRAWSCLESQRQMPLLRLSKIFFHAHKLPECLGLLKPKLIKQSPPLSDDTHPSEAIAGPLVEFEAEPQKLAPAGLVPDPDTIVPVCTTPISTPDK